MPERRDPNNTGRLAYCGTFVFFRVNPTACLPPWTIKIIFIIDLAMTLNPFVFKTLKCSCYNLVNYGSKEDSEILNHSLKYLLYFISLPQHHNLNSKDGL